MAAGTFARYWIAQLPGWGVAAAVLGGAWALFGMPGWVAAALLALIVTKDIVFYPFARRALESPAQSGAAALLGARAIVVDELAPEGKVRIGAELWRAEVRGGGPSLGAGAAVRVAAVRGLTLVVGPEEGSGS
jgi:membrane protein implicated in regulation of membrane protease activity